MRKTASFLAGLAALALTVTSYAPNVFADQPDATQGNAFHAIVATGTTANVPGKDGVSSPTRPAATSNLVYHSGGTVQVGTHHTYAIYWGSSFSTNYKSIINGYFANVAADSGHTSNVYYSDTQYYQTISGVKTYISYSEQYNGSWSDTVLPSSSGCSSTAGGTTKCVSDAQVQAEVTKAINANGWPRGLTNEYFVFLGNGISTCYNSSSCAFTAFCAYHSNYGSGSSNTLYANMPYTGHNLGACSGASGSPNGDAAADATISVTSHEANETITDALGNAWYDRSGNENGDKCAYNYGTRLGTINGGDYNQNIGSGHYELQQEWSNYSSRCVLTGK